jgi:single-stranded DNA-specific DHH superfamily exonuclease
MSHFDAFNGDADGICSLLQLRLAKPMDSVLITGVKRDIALLERIAGRRGDTVTALDISVAANRKALEALLERGLTVEYFDHHFAGELPVHAGATFHIDTSPGVCTGVLVDRALGGKHRIWAIVAAFGDDLAGVALELAGPLGLDETEMAQLQELGECVAYNAYGDSDADLLIHPSALYRRLLHAVDPFRFIHTEPVFLEISRTRRQDLEHARRARPEQSLSGATVYVLPNAPWSRRVRGAFGNELANASPERAHAILTPNAEGGYTVSVRAPRVTGKGADALCRQFATGGGRAQAAGVNHLPVDKLQDFVHRLDRAFHAPDARPGGA